MTSPTIQQIICHNIATAINGNDSNGNLCFDANLLHASPVAEQTLTEILTEYRFLLNLHGSRQIHPNYQDDLRDLWGPLKLVICETAYRSKMPTVQELTRFVNTFVPTDLYGASTYLGKHPNRIARALLTAPTDINAGNITPLIRTIATLICAEEITFAHAAVVKYTSTFHPDFTTALINADEYRVMRERYSDGLQF